VFEEMNALQHFEAFCSLNGPRFYGLPVNEASLSWCAKRARSRVLPCRRRAGAVPAGETVRWTMKK
jgi:dihydroorotase